MPRFVGTLVHIALALFLVFFVGTFIHEAGHAASAIAQGARLAEANVLGIRIYPPIALEPRAGYFGYVTWTGELTPRGAEWTALAGSGATWLASLIALVFFVRGRRSPRAGLARTAHLTFLAMCGDVVVHTLPVFGVSPAFLFGDRAPGPGVSEFWYAALALGCPRTTLTAAIFGYPLLLIGVVIGGWTRGGAAGRSSKAKAPADAESVRSAPRARRR